MISIIETNNQQMISIMKIKQMNIYAIQMNNYTKRFQTNFITKINKWIIMHNGNCRWLARITVSIMKMIIVCVDGAVICIRWEIVVDDAANI